ncbi:Pol polyprotein [Plakobranchus ocellatus]|uniref:Pol polyprotein n=1 Tax=Plakobranchus ocellatus TaxID=259542 RepID=A0AAV4BV55_9GAST|nr:Pol polyprotein [Plakobranchus ocellatus]
MISHEIPNRPWAKLGADIFYFGGHDYLLVVDYFSKYPEIARPSPNSYKTFEATIYANVKQKVQARQEKQKFYYDRATRHHKNFQLDDNVRVQLGKTWERGVITKRHPTPRSYDVTTEDGATLRRNQRFINPSPDKAVIFPTDVSGNMELQHQDHTECGIGDNKSSPMVEPTKLTTTTIVCITLAEHNIQSIYTMWQRSETTKQIKT